MEKIDGKKKKVKKIPEAFSSKSAYLGSFACPLLEETRADLSSSMTSSSNLSLASTCEILLVRKAKKFQLPSDLFYRLVLKRHGAGGYEPAFGDLIALTHVKPKCIDDLNPYVVAFIHKVVVDKRSIPIEFSVLSSKCIGPSN